jgi:hypothetical protein
MALYAQNTMTVTASGSDLSFGGAPANVLDGTQSFWCSPSGMPEYLQFDLGSSKNVGSVQLLPALLALRNNAAGGPPTGYEIYGSNDGTFTDFPAAIASGSWANDDTLKETTFSVVSRRYIRVQFTSVGSGSRAIVAEVYIGDDDTPTPSLRETQVDVYAQYSGDPNLVITQHQAYVAVDLNPNLVVTQHQAYVAVDLNPNLQSTQLVVYVAVPTDEYELEFTPQPLVCIVC